MLRFLARPARALRPVALCACVIGVSMGFAACGDKTSGEAPPEQPRVSTTEATRWTFALGNFLNNGPDDGTWRKSGPHQEQLWRFALHPDDAEIVLAARAAHDGTITQMEAYPRPCVPRLFYEAPSHLFFANYAVAGPATAAALEGYPKAQMVRWRSVHPGGQLTERRAWFDGKGDDVIRIEDRSRTGYVLRTVERLPDMGEPLRLDAETLRRCTDCVPSTDLAHDIERALAAPFAIYEPKRLPPGFIRIRADYTVREIGEGVTDSAVVERASLLYSDGLALISLGIAPKSDMDAIARVYGEMAQGCPGSAPPGAESSEELEPTPATLRMRTDVCRTVLRRDDVPDDISIVLLTRNELPLKAYVDLMSSLERVPAP